MATNQQEKQLPEQEKPELQQQSANIRKHVMQALGQPSDLCRVQVRRLWDDHYRVNILVGPDASCARVAHSFFLVADSAGKITTSTPAIARHY